MPSPSFVTVSLIYEVLWRKWQKRKERSCCWRHSTKWLGIWAREHLCSPWVTGAVKQNHTPSQSQRRALKILPTSLPLHMHCLTMAPPIPASLTLILLICVLVFGILFFHLPILFKLIDNSLDPIELFIQWSKSKSPQAGRLCGSGSNYSVLSSHCICRCLWGFDCFNYPFLYLLLFSNGWHGTFCAAISTFSHCNVPSQVWKVQKAQYI